MATNNKYDRQLRLWGSKGQQALSETHVILVGASACGTETLKNLVLPGIGSFVVVDINATPAKIDATSNFFIPQSQILTGKSKGQIASIYLQELNDDVKGSYQNLSSSSSSLSVYPTTMEGWKTVLKTEIVKSKRIIVIAADLPPIPLESLAKTCHCLNDGEDEKTSPFPSSIPLIIVQSYGLIGCVRLQLPSQGVALLEPKPTNAPPDLRLVNNDSFTSFLEFANSIDLTTLDSQQHGHVPYPILLYKAIQKYKDDHNNQLPKTFDEKQTYKEKYLKALSIDLDKELNFQEAIANSYLAYTDRDLIIPTNIDPNTKLGLLYEALQIFQKLHNGSIPINGSIPDMTSSTEWYVQLQNIYKNQAKQDVDEMTKIIKEQIIPSRSQQDVDAIELTTDDITNFCANIYHVGYMKTRTIQNEYTGIYSSSDDEELVDDWKMSLMDPYEVSIHTPILWYLGLRACHEFCKQYGRYPGMPNTVVAPTTNTTTGTTTAIKKNNYKKVKEDETQHHVNTATTTNVDHDFDWKRDIPVLTNIYQQQIISQYKLTDQQDEASEQLLCTSNVHKICHELTRYGNAEIHTVSSVIGGVASQEAVKVITGQYIPVNNTYVYNGIVSVGGVYKF